MTSNNRLVYRNSSLARHLLFFTKSKTPPYRQFFRITIHSVSLFISPLSASLDVSSAGATAAQTRLNQPSKY